MQLGIHGWTRTQHEIGEGCGPRGKATSLLGEPLRDWTGALYEFSVEVMNLGC